MDPIIDFSKVSKRRWENGAENMSKLLKEAVAICQRDIPLNLGEIDVVGKDGMKKILEKKIVEEMSALEMIDVPNYLCGLYVAGILTKLAVEVPDSWYTVDYINASLKSGNPFVLREGGDMCFVLCGVFPDRKKNRNQADVTFYEEIGSSFYRQFYHFNKQETWNHMSNKFGVMARVAQKCLHNLRNC